MRSMPQVAPDWVVVAVTFASCSTYSTSAFWRRAVSWPAFSEAAKPLMMEYS
jgi:hypothetical protein